MAEFYRTFIAGERTICVLLSPLLAGHPGVLLYVLRTRFQVK